MAKKKCSQCGKEYPLTSEYFPIRKDSKDGFRSQCKQCYSQKKKQYYEENKEYVLEYMGEYRGKNKEKIKQAKAEYYQKNKTLIDEKNKRDYLENRERYLKYFKQYYQENKEEIKKWDSKYGKKNRHMIRRYEKEYYKKNKDKHRAKINRRRARKRGLPSNLTDTQWEKIKKHFNNKCSYCGKETFLEQEHFIPLSEGGEYTHNNIIPACRSCNASKNNKSFFEWYPEQEFYSKEKEKKILEYLGYTSENIQQLSIL